MPNSNESEQYELPAELAALEKSLAGMAPVIPRVDRDQLMFAAGQASVIGQNGRANPPHIAGPSWAGSVSSRFWPAATTLTTAASLILAVALWRQTPSQHSVVAIQPVVNPQAAELDDVIVDRIKATPWSDAANSGYLGLRNVVLTRGVGALSNDSQFAGGQDQQSKSATPYAPSTSRDLLKEFLPEDANGTQPRS